MAVVARPTIHPGVSLADLADATWTLTQRDAQHVLSAHRIAQELDQRISKGYDYIALHEDDSDAQAHLFRLGDRAESAYLEMRSWMVTTWIHCQEVYGLRFNANIASDEPPALWRTLGLSHLRTPGSWPPAPDEKLHWVETRPATIAGWMVTALREGN